MMWAHTTRDFEGSIDIERPAGRIQQGPGRHGGAIRDTIWIPTFRRAEEAVQDSFILRVNAMYKPKRKEREETHLPTRTELAGHEPVQAWKSTQKLPWHAAQAERALYVTVLLDSGKRFQMRARECLRRTGAPLACINRANIWRHIRLARA